MAYIVRKKLDGSTLERWEITDKPLTFGRGEDADVLVKDERMSLQHFMVAPKGEEFVARDLNSTNGTYVNNEPITEVILKPNDRIRAGQTVMVFEADKSKSAAPMIG